MKPLKESFIKAKDLNKIRSKCYVYIPFGEMSQSDLNKFIEEYNLKRVVTQNCFHLVIIDNNEALKYFVDKFSNISKSFEIYKYIGTNNVKEILEKTILKFDKNKRGYIDDDNFIKINNIDEI